MEEDDAMEIEDNLPAAPIIERKSDDFSFTINTSAVENEAINTSQTPIETTNETIKIVDNEDKQKEEDTLKQNKDPDVVILDDDDDEPMKGRLTPISNKY